VCRNDRPSAIHCENVKMAEGCAQLAQTFCNGTRSVPAGASACLSPPSPIK
jgi:hypothetical protein